jgi:hypothetical protein
VSRKLPDYEGVYFYIKKDINKKITDLVREAQKNGSKEISKSMIVRECIKRSLPKIEEELK